MEENIVRKGGIKMNNVSMLTDLERLLRTVIPTDHPVDLILDTDPGNEIDDQFAIAYALLAKDRINLLAIHAEQYRNKPESLSGYCSNTPEDSENMFRNATSSSPAEGADISYFQACKVVKMLGEDPEKLVFRGCTDVLTSKKDYIESPAVNNLIQCAMEHEGDTPLFVVNIGANTNTASAIIKAPEIISKIAVISLCGNSLFWEDNNEFNYFQDPIAAQVIFDSGVPFIQLPGKGVTGFLRISIPEMKTYLDGENEISKFLLETICEYAPEKHVWTKVLWDIAAIAILVNPEWANFKIEHSPLLLSDMHYGYDPRRHLIRVVYYINRDKVFEDLFVKLKMQ